MFTDRQVLASVTVTIDRPRELRLSLRALSRYSARTGKDLFRDQGEMLSTADDLRALVWAMARETDPDVTAAQLSPHITVDVVKAVARAIHQIAEMPLGPGGIASGRN